QAVPEEGVQRVVDLGETHPELRRVQVPPGHGPTHRGRDRIASDRNWIRIWPLVAPRARRRPISERRSSTEITMMLATPTAPTSKATAPRPRNRPLKAF